MSINVYTDGACSRNGRHGAIAGIGVYFGKNDIRNCSERISGKQTNNTAEIKAIIKAAETLDTQINSGYHVNIFSDSEYAMRCCSDYGEKLEKLNWEKNVPNLKLVQQAYYIFKNKTNVQFHYIAAHTGKQDEHSLGNEAADALACLAIGVSPKKSNKIYIKLPYAEKEKGKRLGTRWDPKRKQWYILSDMNENNKKIILNLWG